MILLLEDNPDRVRAFRAVLMRELPDARIMIWSDAHVMIREIVEHLPNTRLISLDHDLYVPAGSPDPGDGLDVARFLTSMSHAKPPVIVHSSNSVRAQRMMGEFELAQWPCARVLPFGENWIENEWRVMVMELLRTR